MTDVDDVNENAALVLAGADAEIVPVPVDEKPGNITVGTLRFLGYDVTKPETQALVLVCHRYKLDPLSDHVKIIDTAQGPRVYVTAVGYREIAEQSGELVSMLETETHHGETGYRVRVQITRAIKRGTAVYEFAGGCGANEAAARAGKGMALARTRAIRTALRWAFPVRARYVLDADPDDYDADTDVDVDTIDVAAPAELGPERAPVVDRAPASAPRHSRPPTMSEQSAAHAAVARLADPDKAAFLETHGIEDFGMIWPEAAVIAGLELPL